MQQSTQVIVRSSDYRHNVFTTTWGKSHPKEC